MLHPHSAVVALASAHLNFSVVSSCPPIPLCFVWLTSPTCTSAPGNRIIIHLQDANSPHPARTIRADHKVTCGATLTIGDVLGSLKPDFIFNEFRSQAMCGKVFNIVIIPLPGFNE